MTVMDTLSDEYVVHLTVCEGEVECFGLPWDADAAHLTATWSHGTLELRAPRLSQCVAAVRKVQVPIRHRIEMNPDASGL